MIHIYEKLEDVPTPPPQGTFAVVDVLRFSTTACTIFEQGARLIHPVNSEEEAFRIKSENDDAVLAGERDAIRIPGFDTGNSPARISEMDLTGRELVCLTSNGTRALNRLSDRNVILATLTNASSAASFLSRRETVHLVACGSGGASCQEDLAGVELLRTYLKEGAPDDEQKRRFRERVRTAPHARRLADRGYEADVRQAANINQHDVVPVQDAGLVQPGDSASRNEGE